MPTVAPPNASRSEIWGESEAMAPQALPNLALSAAAWVRSCWTVGAAAQERPWTAEARVAAGVALKRISPKRGISAADGLSSAAVQQARLHRTEAEPPGLAGATRQRDGARASLTGGSAPQQALCHSAATPPCEDSRRAAITRH